MDQPLGWAIGNAIEIEEARDAARGRARRRRTSSRSRSRPPDACSRSPTSASTPTRARGAPRQAIDDGSALEAYERWIAAQGGDPSLDVLPKAPVDARADRGPRGLRRRGLRARARPRRARPRRRPPHEGGRDRPRGRHPLLRQARRRGRGGPDPRRRLRAGRGDAPSRPSTQIRALIAIADEPQPPRPIVLETLT